VSRYFLRSKISPTLDLDTITIRLRPDAPVPTVEMSGRVLLSNPRARAVTRATIETAYLTPKGAAFVEELKALFEERVSAPADLKENNDR